ncbi:hypothetical protein A4A49_31041 [Nicotiana attenuata]|uniref:Carboxypeptidase A inhibitor-like domain-containing protein n=1 Tax=Nicotiana attenuata TaxID=49451 RepID=A0A1J6JFP4_NICAT|nr:hypothetical protein A4A49_31041 [Nicotiana attenuata]
MPFKLGSIFTILLLTASINLSWFPKTQAMSTRDINHDALEFQRRLLPQVNDLITCGRGCTTKSDCSDCWLCCDCDLALEVGSYVCVH